MNGVACHQQTHRGARSSLGTIPSGGVQFHPGRTPGGTAQPPGDGMPSSPGKTATGHATAF
jgi:hypothetical protein